MFKGHYLFENSGSVISEITSCSASAALQQFFEYDFPNFLGTLSKERRNYLIDQLSSKHGEFIKNKYNHAYYIESSDDKKAADRYKQIKSENFVYYYSVDRNYHNIQDTMKKIVDVINTECDTSLRFSYV